MILRGDRGSEAFLDAVARHLTPHGWRKGGPLEADVVFGAGFWTGKLIREPEGPIEGIRLRSDEYGRDEIATVEDAVAILEGLEFVDEEAPASEDDEDDH